MFIKKLNKSLKLDNKLLAVSLLDNFSQPFLASLWGVGAKVHDIT
jgi:hypothetical protein